MERNKSWAPWFKRRVARRRDPLLALGQMQNPYLNAYRNAPQSQMGGLASSFYLPSLRMC